MRGEEEEGSDGREMGSWQIGHVCGGGGAGGRSFEAMV